MENETSNSQYEIAYHLTPDLDETGIAKEVKGLNDYIVQQGGTISKSEEPKRKHLSYPIQHRQYAFFGFMEFTAPSEALESIAAHLKLQPQFFRHVIIKKPNLKEYRILGIARSSRLRSTETSTTTAIPLSGQAKLETRSQTAEQEKKMTDDLEVVLENL